MTRRFSLIVLLGVLGTLLVVPNAAAGGGCHAPSGLEITATDDTAALIGECAFRPTVTFIEPGESVTWTNKDMFGHTVTGAMESWGDVSEISQGESVTYRFKEEGVFPYFCAYHPSMVGAVVVGDAEASLASSGTVTDPADPVSGPAAQTDPKAETTQTSSRAPLAIGVATIVGLGISAVAWRHVLSRRRASMVSTS